MRGEYPLKEISERKFLGNERAKYYFMNQLRKKKVMVNEIFFSLFSF